MKKLNRRQFIQRSGAFVAAASLPVSLVEIAFGKNHPQNFTFGFISDSHITHIKGKEFVRNWDQGLKRAVAEANLMDPKPDFIIYGGDLAQLGKPEEIDHALDMLSGLRVPVKYVMGEHDYYVDLGAHWRKRLGPDHYSFDHKGVHFIVLNSILTYEDWMHKDWKDGMERMLQMARLDNPKGSPFMVGEKQRQWMKKDLAKVSHDTPVVVLSHSPLQKIFKGWNFWTEDAEHIHALLKPYKKVTVLYGHVHQIQYNQIGNISFHAAMATAWPWPYPSSYSQAVSHVPKLTVPMNRADPFFERDATGWQFINLHSGRVDLEYILWENNKNRTVRFDAEKGHPVDAEYQDPAKHIPPQEHY